MTYDTLFSLVNLSVLPAWAALLLLPRRGWSQVLARSITVPAVCTAYLALLLYGLVAGQGAEGVSFTSIAGVAAIFAHPLGVVTAWAHYLAFDLFVGAWLTRDAMNRGMARLAVLPCQILCFLAGPVGLLLYLGLREVRSRRLTNPHTVNE